MVYSYDDISIPPIPNKQLIDGNPYFSNFLANSLANSYVYIANSCDGNRIKAKGPSPLIIGIFISSSIEVKIAGNKNTKVFP